MVKEEIRGMRVSIWQVVLVLLLGVMLFIDIPEKIKEIKEILRG